MLKQFYPILITLAIVSAAAGYKTYTAKAGETYPIFYRQSLTTDNILKTVTLAAAREHTAYNKDKVAYVRFSPGGKASIGYGSPSVLLRHYAVNIVFKDSTNVAFLAYSKDTLSTFKYYPKGFNILLGNHPAKYVTWTVTKNVKAGINEFRGAKINIPMWEIKYDGVTQGIDYRTPLNSKSNLFQPDHLY